MFGMSFLARISCMSLLFLLREMHSECDCNIKRVSNEDPQVTITGAVDSLQAFHSFQNEENVVHSLATDL